jgi:hypothetical protein
VVDANNTVPSGVGDFEFAFKPSPPPTGNGVEDGESAIFKATLTTQPLGDTLDLSSFQVAYHVQNIAPEGGSDVYLGTGTENIIVPEPTAATMAGLAGALMLLRRRRV